MRTRTSFISRIGRNGGHFLRLEIYGRIDAAAVEPSACLVDLCEIERVAGCEVQLAPHKIRTGALIPLDDYVANKGLSALDDVKRQVRPGRGDIEDDAERDRDIVVAFAAVEALQRLDRISQGVWIVTASARRRDRSPEFVVIEGAIAVEFQFTYCEQRALPDLNYGFAGGRCRDRVAEEGMSTLAWRYPCSR